MLSHLRACLTLLIVTVVLCSVVYPLALLGVGKGLFSSQAEGSLIRDKSGKTIGSRLIGQAFGGDEYFQPRPSATSPANNGAVSGASNWGANNPLLRDRVARQLGPIVKYRSGGVLVGPDVEKWFQQQKADYVKQWAADRGSLAEQWIKDHPEAVAELLGEDLEKVKAYAGDYTTKFFEAFAAKHPGQWPTLEDVKAADGSISKKLKPAKDGPDVQAYLFDPWRQEHASVELENVPADMVMASGSGLDPHITLTNARYQLERVAGAWATKTKRDPAQVRREIDKILEEKKEAPLGGLVGVPLVNVLEVNLAIEGRVTGLPERASR